MPLNNYSLEERLVEPFRSIRWLAVTPLLKLFTFICLVLFLVFWWFERSMVFECWGGTLSRLTHLLELPWHVGIAQWPDPAHAYLAVPTLEIWIVPPSTWVWWSFVLGTGAVWMITGRLKQSFLPVRTAVRFLLMPLWITIVWFVVFPLKFNHTIEEWSRIYFLVSYGSVAILSIIWTFGVLWFPIPLFTKLLMSSLWIIYTLFGVPVLFFISCMLLNQTSLLLLPTFALGIVPLVQLGWFVAFYSIALSAGSKTR